MGVLKDRERDVFKSTVGIYYDSTEAYAESVCKVVFKYLCLLKIMFNNYKKKKESTEKTVNTVLIVILLVIVCGVGFMTYRFFQGVADNDAYSIGSGNRFMNLIQSRIYGEKVEEEEKESINLKEIKHNNKELIASSMKAIYTQEKEDDLAFLNHFPLPDAIEMNINSYVIEPNSIPCVIFTALSNPVLSAFCISN